MTKEAIQALIQGAEQLVNRVMIDNGGMGPGFPDGNGGLLSLETIQCANNLTKTIHMAKKEFANGSPSQS